MRGVRLEWFHAVYAVSTILRRERGELRRGGSPFELAVVHYDCARDGDVKTRTPRTSGW